MNLQSPPSVLFLGKKDDSGCLEALEHLKQTTPNVTSCLGDWKDSLPAEAISWQGDYIISYLSRWIIPPSLLAQADKASINFHPAPPEYPGIGCFNFALYDEAGEYGATCHHMNAKVDDGEIVAVKRFPIDSTDTVSSLITHTYELQLDLFKEILTFVAQKSLLPSSSEKWSAPPRTRNELNALSQITPNMSREEIEKRIRATSYGPFQPFIMLQGHRFDYIPS